MPGDACHLVPHCPFYSGDHSCVPDGIRFRDADLASDEKGWFEFQRRRYLSIALLLVGIWLLLFCGSQLAHLFSTRQLWRSFAD